MGIWEFDNSRIRLARESKDMSQSDMAEMIGVTTQQISMWETGQVKPGQESLLKIVNTLGIHPRFFFVRCAQNGNDKATNQ